MRNIRISKTAFYVTTGILLLLAIGTGIYFWQQSRSLGDQNDALESTLQALELEKSRMEGQLDSLTVSYDLLRSENEDLRGKESTTAVLIAQKDASIKKIRSQTRRDLESLRRQLEELGRIKIEYETVIATLRSENDQLRLENERLSGENSQLRTENAGLNDKMDHLAKKLEDQIRQTQSARFKATSFRVEVARRNEKLTSRARKAREILVSFDLADVPQEYQGGQKLYLSITDDRGVPVSANGAVTASVTAPAGPLSVIAQQTKAVSLKDTQRLSFSYKFDDRLKSGNYVVAIYCDTGLLGAASFRLT